MVFTIYDPVGQVATKLVNISDFPINDAALALDGSIYLSKPNNHVDTTKALFTLSEGILLHFNIDSGLVETIQLPNTDCPIFNGLLIDHQGRLWVGSIGYFDLGGGGDGTAWYDPQTGSISAGRCGSRSMTTRRESIPNLRLRL